MEQELSSIYRIMFENQSSESLDPSRITSQLLNCNVPERSHQSTLLWLSILRRLLMVGSPDRDNITPSPHLQENTAVKLTVLDNLLKEDSFIPLVITFIAHGNQLVCYLASKVLSLAVLASQQIKEEWMKDIIAHISHTNHEPVYIIEVLKQLMKSMRKKKHPHGNKMIHIYSSVLLNWKRCFSVFSSRLEETVLSKWPELNFIELLSWSNEILRHSPSDENEATLLILNCNSMIIDNIVDLTISVSNNCASPISLKELLKIYCKIAENSKNLESCVLQKQLKSCLPHLLNSKSFVDTVNAVLQHMGGISVSSNLDNVDRSVVRKAVLFLLKYGKLLEDNVDIIHYEKHLSTFFHDRCNLDLSRHVSSSSMQLVRHNLFELLNEQDDDILDMLISIYNILRKRILWEESPTLHFCFSAAHLHSMIINLLQCISYDHSLLLDFIVSPETMKFYTFLMEYLQTCIEDWGDICMACQEMDSYQSTRDGCLTNHGGEDLSGRGSNDSKSSVNMKGSSVIDEEVYIETTLDRVMDCFIKLKYALLRLSSSQLLPTPVDALISVLCRVEDLYEQ